MLYFFKITYFFENSSFYFNPSTKFHFLIYYCRFCFLTLGGNAALNEVPHWGRFRESLLWSGSKARKGGTKLRLTTLFMHVLARCPDKADYFHKVTKAIWFSAAFRHIFQNTGSAKHVGILVSFSWTEDNLLSELGEANVPER